MPAERGIHSLPVQFRAGQQIISWGEIEGIEAPSDVVIPWDFTTMSNYFEFSRIGVVAANLTFHFAKQQLQFIWMPLFQPAKLPEESLYKRGVKTDKFTDSFYKINGCHRGTSKPSAVISRTSDSRLFMTACRVCSKCSRSSIAATAPARARRSRG